MFELLDAPYWNALSGVLGLLVGAAVAYWRAHRRYRQLTTLAEQAQQQQFDFWQQQEAQKDQQLQALQQQLGELKDDAQHSQRSLQNNMQQLGQFKQLAEQVPELQQEAKRWLQELQRSQQHNAELKVELEANKATYAEQQNAANEKLQTLQDAEQRLKGEFENLANRIFEQKSEKYSQTSKAGLDAILTPLKEQIDGFKKQITDQYVKEGQERSVLKSEILSLKELNQQITHEASALTKALKGDNKQQGNWGELVLATILQESGLREGHEYQTQVSLKNEAGKNYQPDVLVHLPNEKDVVIDSKVSLAAYERYFREEDETLRTQHLKEHINSLRAHIKALGSKDYQDLQGLRSLDYVLMFVPVEPAFLLAVDKEPALVRLALDNNILLVSPTNLHVALRTINNIWQVEQQNQNAQLIADKAAALYDKFVGFTEDMQAIGRALQSTQGKYDEALKKLSEGKGNLVRRTNEFRQLGVQTKKSLSANLLDKAQD